MRAKKKTENDDPGWNYADTHIEKILSPYIFNGFASITSVVITHTALENATLANVQFFVWNMISNLHHLVLTKNGAK